jgi:tetratricopeptide (TPR) repeat protein
MVRRASVADRVRAPAFAFAASVAGFWPSLRGGFVWDDWTHLARTYGYRALDARHLAWMLTTSRISNYTPLAWLSYALDYQVWRLAPLGYHLTNLFLHATAAALFCVLARRLLTMALPDARPRELELGALVAALAFALHPMRAESVAWISERRDVLSAPFFIATILFYLDAAPRPSGPERRRALAAALACYAAAALSKATVVPLPLGLLALDWYPLKRLSARDWRERVVEKLPFFAIAAAASVLAVWAQSKLGGLVGLSDHGMAGRLSQGVASAGFYLEKTVAPVGLYGLYPLPHDLGPLYPPVLAAAASVVAVAVGLRWAGVPARARAALWVYYLAMILPVSGIVQNGHQLVALRYSYLSCLGWAVLAGAAAARALRTPRRAASAATLTVLAVWLAADAVALPGQIAHWRDDRSLWTAVLERFPDSTTAHKNMAQLYLRERDFVAAETSARAALAVEPGDDEARAALAASLAGQRRFDAAIVELQALIAKEPDSLDANSLLAVALHETGRDPEAIVHALRAAQVNPGNADVLGNAGALLASTGRLAEAVPFFERAAALEPSDPRRAAMLERARRELAASPAR